ncbi:MAG: putative nucleotidyl transferase [Leptospirillum rubarum]|nr:MAG: putative nucleotidyl transferase [Leptospirillum rubarum]
MYPVALLAGGLATRLRPITEKIPKALIEVAGQPFIFRQLNYLKGQGVTQVVLCTGYLGEQIEAIVGDGSSIGLDVRYSPDGPVLLGTGGALRKALPLLDKSFFVLYGDSFLPCDFKKVQAAFETGGKPSLMTVLRNENRWDKSNVLFREGSLIEYNKSLPKPEMEHIDYGLGILSAEVLMEYPAGQPLDLADVYHRLSLDGSLAGFEVNERFYEIGSHSGLRETERYFQSQEQ